MFQTFPISLRQLLDHARSGSIQLPDFQRGWVWDDDRIKALLASISRGFPVGAIMMLQAGGEIRFKSRMIEGVNGDAPNEANEYLLDGQQRLTSLYQALLHEGSVTTRNNRGQQIKRRYYIDMRAAMNPFVDREEAIISVPAPDRKIVRNSSWPNGLDLSSVELEYEEHMMPTERLLDISTSWLLGYIGYWQSGNREHSEGDAVKFYNSFNESVIISFTSYSLPVITLTKDTPKEAVCTVFEKVNTGGVSLSMFELATAIFAADAEDKDFSLREDWSRRQDRLRSAYGVLQGIGGDQFLQAVALLETQDKRRKAIADSRPQHQLPAISCRRNDILSLELKEYFRWSDHVEQGFKDAAKFLARQFIFTAQDVPYNTQLVPLAALHTELGRELQSAKAQALLERWFWSGIFGESYGSAVETQYSRDLEQVADWIRGGPVPAMVNEANFIPERLISLRTRNSAAYKGLYALQMKSGAADWGTAQRLALSLTPGTWKLANVDIHHIFPKRWCQKVANPSIPQWLYNSVINKTPIDATTNRSIGGRAPSEYLPILESQAISADALDKVLTAHWIKPTLLRSDSFGECFVERGEEMLKLVGNAMGRSIPSGRDVFESVLKNAGIFSETEAPATVVEIVSDYEESDVEYDAVGDTALEDDSSIAAD